MFWIDNIDMSLVAEAFNNLLQAAIIVITLVRFEGAVLHMYWKYTTFSKLVGFDAGFSICSD